MSTARKTILLVALYLAVIKASASMRVASIFTRQVGIHLRTRAKQSKKNKKNQPLLKQKLRVTEESERREKKY
jgi:hypothetical protein